MVRYDKERFTQYWKLAKNAVANNDIQLAKIHLEEAHDAGRFSVRSPLLSVVAKG